MNDLSKKEKTVTYWLEHNFEKIKLIYKDKNTLICFLATMKNEVHVSDEYLNSLLRKIDKMKTSELCLDYLYSIYLKGSGLGLDID